MKAINRYLWGWKLPEVKFHNERFYSRKDNRISEELVVWYRCFGAVVIAVASFMFSEPSLSQEEKEALAAFEESKKAMLFLSENLNKGAEKLALVNQFTETKNRILK